MSDDRSEIARTDGQAGFVTYSRIEPREDKAERQGPILTGIEVPGNLPSDDDLAPDVRADERVVPPRRGGGRAFAVFAVFALVAFAGGVGVLAGSFLFPTVGKVVPVPGGGKSAIVATESEVVTPAPQPEAAPATKSVVKVGTDRFAAAYEGAKPTTLASPSEPVEPAVAASDPALTTSAPAPAPVPRVRPAPVAAKPVLDPVAAPASESGGVAPANDPLAMPGGAQKSEIAGLPVPVAPQTHEFGSALPLPPQPGEFRADETNDPLAPPTVVVPDHEAEGLSPPAEIPGSGDSTDQDFAHRDMAPADAVPIEELNEPYQSALDRWVVLGVRDGRAIIDGRERGVFMVVEGSEIPGVGIVEDISRRKGRWAVVTTNGSIYSVERAERRRFWLSRLFN